ncbi:MAG: sulfurtransferase TusA family protein [Deltaproteobacteria bacterium]|nr:sulfurtransferase TusA family protein [Deltaproteobacteria bacterium]
MAAALKIQAEKNCRGVSCPMNLVYTKVQLAKLQGGEILSLIIDDGPPINNVPDSLAREGHEILDKKQLADGAWQVLIRKA